ncbi:protein S100-A10 isoform X1 [Corvus moneduloides]|uniref:protein S100-A10 isoform X1 n=1 Tax=Corvus moneduloides TaxID=1196302 RepID=UPI0013637156|nr:protein S100-A10 isoform X1 [Corvus moneduloides]XP_031949221.1 protein S100-A10 isoform X1 [Corvus moneduloides]XP_031949222.1 protein S100-A10 isoform X1 [Corvus moneduloides]XP_031949223.1 protein S100-A10 isoform X1 [Corvus moneduloides]
MPSQLEHAMETLMFTFHKYAGDKEHLAKEDLRELMDKEFPGFLENQRDPQALERVLDHYLGSDPFFPIFAHFPPFFPQNQRDPQTPLYQYFHFSPFLPISPRFSPRTSATPRPPCITI